MGADESIICLYCHGSGIVLETTFCLSFEYRQFCTKCETGRLKQSQLSEYLSRLKEEEKESKKRFSKYSKAAH